MGWKSSSNYWSKQWCWKGNSEKTSTKWLESCWMWKKGERIEGTNSVVIDFIADFVYYTCMLLGS